MKAIERATRQPVAPLTLPTIKTINDFRIAKFKDQISDTLAEGGLEVFRSLIEEYEAEKNVPAVEIAAALAKLARGEVPLLLEKQNRDAKPAPTWQDERPARPARSDFANRSDFRSEAPSSFGKKERVARAPDPGMTTYRIAVGHQHGVKPGNIVGAIANEGGVDSKNIGRIEIYDDYSVLDMPSTMSSETLELLQGTIVAGQRLRIMREGAGGASGAPAAAPAAAPKKKYEASGAKESGSPMNLEKFSTPIEGDEPAAAPKKKKGVKEEFAMETYRIEVGSEHGVKPANIVGAIANEAGLEARHIGRIDIFDNYTVLDLPERMPKELLEHLKTVWVAGKQLNISPSSHGGKPPSKPGLAKATFGERKTGGDRRFADKGGDKKPHRKGPK